MLGPLAPRVALIVVARPARAAAVLVAGTVDVRALDAACLATAILVLPRSAVRAGRGGGLAEVREEQLLRSRTKGVDSSSLMTTENAGADEAGAQKPAVACAFRVLRYLVIPH